MRKLKSRKFDFPSWLIGKTIMAFARLNLKNKNIQIVSGKYDTVFETAANFLSIIWETILIVLREHEIYNENTLYNLPSICKGL